MHPLEHLRYVARAGEADPRLLVEETAAALRALAPDPAGLLLAVRRMVERHPDCGPLWVLCSRMLRADDPRAVARRTVDELLDDPTSRALDRVLDDLDTDGHVTVCATGRSSIVSEVVAGRPDVHVVIVDDDRSPTGGVRRLGAAVRRSDAVLVEALALDGDVAIVPAGSLALASVARTLGVPVLVVAGASRRLPSRTAAHVRGALERVGAEASEVLPLADGDRLVTPDGVVDRTWARTADCEAVTELLVTIPN